MSTIDLFDLAAKLTLDSSEYTKSIKDSENSSESLTKTIEKTGAQTETLQNKLSVLQNKYAEAQKKVEKLTEEFNKSAKEAGTDAEATQKLADELSKAESDADKLAKQTEKMSDQLNDAEDASEDLTEDVDDLTDELEDYSSEAETAENKTSKFGEALKSGLAVGAKAAAVAITAAVTAIGTLVTKSVQAYAEFEQLRDGVKKLYGTAYDEVMQYSEVAYKTVGMSANTYLQNTTAFSSKLISDFSGDTVKAAEYANKAMTQIADNANTFGTYSVDELTDVYKALSKGMYTTLDNLNLGFNGTKSELQRLLDTAEEVTGIHYDIENFADIIDAIGVIQDGLQITGTTANEAERTIQGSINMTKAAWENLVTGLSDNNADITQLVGNLISSAGKVAKNIIPTVKQALSGIGTAVAQMAPELSSGLSSMITEVLPGLASDALTLVETLVTALIDNADQIIVAAFEIIDTLVTALSEPGKLSGLIKAAFQIVTKLVKGLAENAPELITAAVKMIKELVDGLTDPDTLSDLIDSAIELVTALQEGLLDPETLNLLFDAAVSLVENLVLALIENAPKMIEASIQLMINWIGGILSYWWEKAGEIAQAIWDWFNNSIITPIANFFQQIWTKIQEFFEPLIEFIQPILTALQNLHQTVWQAIHDIVSGILQKIKTFISQKWGEIKTKVSETVTGIKEKVVEKFKAMYENIKEPIENVVTKVSTAFETIKTTISGVVESAFSWGKDLLQNFIDGIASMIDSLTSTVSGIASTILSYLGFSEPEKGPLSNFHTFAPDMMQLFIKGVKDNEKALRDQVASSFDFTDLMPTGGEINYTANVSGTHTESETDRKIDKIMAILDEYLPELAKMNITLDTGVLVGELTPGIDTTLGGRSAYAMRGNAV